MRYVRTKGFYAKKSGGFLVVYPYIGLDPVVLHPSSVMLYSLVDGNQNKAQLFETVSSIITNSEELSREDFESSFSQLIELGLIESSSGKTLSPNFISVSFIGFGEKFNNEKNYFLESLIHHFIPIIVNPVNEDPNLSFILDGDQIINYNHLSQESISFGIRSSHIKNPKNTYDFNIITIENEAENSIFLPFWAIHFPWHDHFESLSIDHDRFDQLAFSPRNFGNKIFTFLNSYFKELNTDAPENHWKKEKALSISNITISPDQRGRLTIGMATYDDYDGPYFTIQSIRLYHSEVLERVDFLLLDNNPGGKISTALKALEDFIPNYRYLAYDEYNGTSIRDLIFREAKTEYVMSIDSHVMLVPGSIIKLLDYLDKRPGSKDLYQGPIIYDDLRKNSYSSSFKPAWKKGMYGTWEKDPRALNLDADPFEISMQGLGLFVCRRNAWPGFNPRFRGFGGEEGYIQEKFRLNGHKTICLPFLRWLHRFGRPNGTIYPNFWEDRVHNYYLGFKEIGWDTTPIDFHFAEELGPANYSMVLKEIKNQLNSFPYYFDAVYSLTSRDEKIEKREPPVNTIKIPSILRKHWYEIDSDGKIPFNKCCIEIAKKAKKYGINTVMIVPDNTVLSSISFYAFMEELIDELKEQKWNAIEINSIDENKYDYTLKNKNIFPLKTDASDHCAILLNIKNLSS